jgi:hypothetical protein
VGLIVVNPFDAPEITKTPDRTVRDVLKVH